jgi:2'-5' RNA ligase
MRAFVAVPVPRGDTRDFGVDAPDHLTLRFLGEIDPPTSEGLIRRLTPVVAAAPPFEFVLEGVGAFPSTARPRVVWRGVTRGAEELGGLAQSVRDAVELAGVPADPAPFIPHVTLFRVRSPRERERATRMLTPGALVPPAQVVPVESVHLVESELTPAGARHRSRALFPLAGTRP